MCTLHVVLLAATAFGIMVCISVYVNIFKVIIRGYIFYLRASPAPGAPDRGALLHQRGGALGVHLQRAGALPQVLQLLGGLAHGLLEAQLHHGQHRVVQEGGVVHHKGLLLAVLLAAQAVVHVLHRHQDDLPQALQQHHVQLGHVQLQALLQEAHHLLGEAHHRVAQVHPAVVARVLLKVADAADAHLLLRRGGPVRVVSVRYRYVLLAALVLLMTTDYAHYFIGHIIDAHKRRDTLGLLGLFIQQLNRKSNIDFNINIEENI